jgi:hypothetical protein
VNERLKNHGERGTSQFLAERGKARYPDPCGTNNTIGGSSFSWVRRFEFWRGSNPEAHERYSECAMKLKRVAVYCGSASGADPVFLAEARALGSAIAEAGLGLVYGGASVGLMGAVADAALAGGADVIGVLPEILSGSEIAHRGLTRLEMVPTMHERKARMVKLADAFLMLPGGYGTLDEMMEIVTWKQLRLHAKPCILINTAGYWDGLLAFLDRAVEAGFLKAENRRLLEVVATAEQAVQRVTSVISGQ